MSFILDMEAVSHFSWFGCFLQLFLQDMSGSQSHNQVQWTEAAMAAFYDIRQSLSKQPVLYSPDFNDAYCAEWCFQQEFGDCAPSANTRGSRCDHLD